MSDAGTPTQREVLLVRASQEAERGGLADLSLRQIAERLGTSHRMLIYHFGSKRGLLALVVAEVERRQRDLLTQLRAEGDIPPAELAHQLWEHLADPQMWPQERVFFEVYAQALQGRDHTADFLGQVLEPWFDLLAEMNRAEGLPPDIARAQARLGVAVVRGLLLDLLATGDREGVDRAMELFIAGYAKNGASHP